MKRDWNRRWNLHDASGMGSRKRWFAFFVLLHTSTQWKDRSCFMPNDGCRMRRGKWRFVFDLKMRHAVYRFIFQSPQWVESEKHIGGGSGGGFFSALLLPPLILWRFSHSHRFFMLAGYTQYIAHIFCIKALRGFYKQQRRWTFFLLCCWC